MSIPINASDPCVVLAEMSEVEVQAGAEVEAVLGDGGDAVAFAGRGGIGGAHDVGGRRGSRGVDRVMSLEP